MLGQETEALNESCCYLVKVKLIQTPNKKKI